MENVGGKSRRHEGAHSNSDEALVPAIPTDDEELRELGKDLRIMGCEGLLAQPWNVQEDKVLREFKFERGNQWIGSKRRDPENWTPDTWARVYGVQRGVEEGWAARKDGLFAVKFRGDVIRRKASTPRTAGTLGRGEC